MKAYTILGAALWLSSVACQGPKAASGGETETAAEENESPAKLVQVWESDAIFRTNESVLYYSEQDLLFVSCIAGQPTMRDGIGHIARLKPDGTLIDSAWASGFHAPKGMCIFQDRLYFTDIDRIVSISVHNPDDRLFYPLGGAEFLNDLTPGQRGVYFSDMNTGMLHYFEAGIIHTINGDLPGLNGLAYYEDFLYTLSSKGLQKLSMGGEVLETINAEFTGGDGLIPLGNNRFIASRWQGEIWLIEGAEAHQLLDSKAEEIQTADLGFRAADNTLFVPRFFSDKVTAYRLDF